MQISRKREETNRYFNKILLPGGILVLLPVLLIFVRLLVIFVSEGLSGIPGQPITYFR